MARDLVETEVTETRRETRTISVEVPETKTVTEQVTICDECGQEATNPLTYILGNPEDHTFEGEEIADDVDVRTAEAIVQHTTAIDICEDCARDGPAQMVTRMNDVLSQYFAFNESVEELSRGRKLSLVGAIISGLVVGVFLLAALFAGPNTLLAVALVTASGIVCGYCSIRYLWYRSHHEARTGEIDD